MKYVVLFFIFFISLSSYAQAPGLDNLRLNAINFDKHWCLYLRELFGCESDFNSPIDKDHCLPSRAIIDYRAFDESRKEAKKVFGFKD